MVATWDIVAYIKNELIPQRGDDDMANSQYLGHFCGALENELAPQRGDVDISKTQYVYHFRLMC